MDTTHGFNFYEGTARAHSQEPRVTVRSGGLMVITPAAIEMLGDDVTHVQLGLNPKTNTVAIRKAADNTKGRYLLRIQKNSPMLLIGAKKFFAHHDLPVDKAKSYDATKVADGLVGFTLTNGNATASNGLAAASSGKAAASSGKAAATKEKAATKGKSAKQ